MVVSRADVMAALRVVEMVVGFLVVVGEWKFLDVVERAWVDELADFVAEDTVIDEKGRCDAG